SSVVYVKLSLLHHTCRESVEADKPVGRGDQIADDRQPSKQGPVTERQLPAVGSVGAGKKFQTAPLESLKFRIPSSGDGVVHAIEVNFEPFREGRLRQAQPPGKVLTRRVRGNEHAQFFSAKEHGESGLVRCASKGQEPADGGDEVLRAERFLQKLVGLGGMLLDEVLLDGPAQDDGFDRRVELLAAG